MTDVARNWAGEGEKKMTLHLVTSIPQTRGYRHILMKSARAAREWREEIRHDRAMIDGAAGDYHVDDHGGRLSVTRSPNAAIMPAEWAAIRAAIQQHQTGEGK